jgi:hypothetical protein
MSIKAKWFMVIYYFVSAYGVGMGMFAFGYFINDFFGREIPFLFWEWMAIGGMFGTICFAYLLCKHLGHI